MERFNMYSEMVNDKQTEMQLKLLELIKSLSSGIYTQLGPDRPKYHSSKLCSNNSEVLGIEWEAVGITLSGLTKAEKSTTHMPTNY